MQRMLAGLLLGLMAHGAQAINWEATITNTNTPLLDSDIQAALSKGISANFANTFPGLQYGISVRLDTHSVPQLNGDLVYLSLELSHRLTNGALELPVGRYSDAVIIPKDSSIETRKDLIVQKLIALAGSFSVRRRSDRLDAQSAGCSRLSGSNSSRRLFGQVGSFSRVSRRQAAGSRPLSLAVPSRVWRTAARRPARSDPVNNQVFFPRAIGRMTFSTGLLSMGRWPVAA